MKRRKARTMVEQPYTYSPEQEQKVEHYKAANKALVAEWDQVENAHAAVIAELERRAEQLFNAMFHDDVWFDECLETGRPPPPPKRPKRKGGQGPEGPVTPIAMKEGPEGPVTPVAEKIDRRRGRRFVEALIVWEKRGFIEIPYDLKALGDLERRTEQLEADDLHDLE
jgi:hypothetical protein